MCGNKKTDISSSKTPTQVAEDEKLKGCLEEEERSDCLWLVVHMV